MELSRGIQRGVPLRARYDLVPFQKNEPDPVEMRKDSRRLSALCRAKIVLPLDLQLLRRYTDVMALCLGM